MPLFFRAMALLQCLIVVAASGLPCYAKATREQIAAFSERCKNEKKRADFIAEFGNDFTGLDLSRIDFRGHHYVNHESNLRNADFSNCNLQGAEFGAAVLDGAAFTDANLEQSSFVTASLKNTTFTRVNFGGTRFYQSDLSGAKLIAADLSSANITGSNFSEADLTDANLSGASNEYSHSDFRFANLTKANLSGLNLYEARFQNAVLRSCDLSRTRLIQANFTAADLTGANFNDADVKSAVFRDALGLSDAERARLEGQALRWKYELKTSINSLLKSMYFPAYAAVILAIVSLSSHVLKLPDKHQAVKVAAVCNLLAIVPAIALLLMNQLGASPTRQFNAGNHFAMMLWSSWVILWPLFVLMLFSCLVLLIATIPVFISSLWWRADLKQSKIAIAYMILTAVHCFFAFDWIFRNFPDA